jgi:hypothetical protein
VLAADRCNQNSLQLWHAFSEGFAQFTKPVSQMVSDIFDKLNRIKIYLSLNLTCQSSFKPLYSEDSDRFKQETTDTKLITNAAPSNDSILLAAQSICSMNILWKPTTSLFTDGLDCWTGNWSWKEKEGTQRLHYFLESVLAQSRRGYQYTSSSTNPFSVSLLIIKSTPLYCLLLPKHNIYVMLCHF